MNELLARTTVGMIFAVSCALAGGDGPLRVAARHDARRACPRPSARAFATAVYDESRALTLLFGGQDPGGATTADRRLWGFDGTRWTALAEDGPEPRYEAVMAYDPARSLVVLWGGRRGDEGLTDTWTWDGAAWTLVGDGVGPSSRAHAAGAFDRERGVLVVFGGYDHVANRHLGDTWEWDGLAWAERAVAGPGPRALHAMGYDTSRKRVVLYGGGDDAGMLTDTWEWDGTSWTMVAATGPEVFPGPSLTPIDQAGTLLLFGGYNGRKNEKLTWLWDGSTWASHEPTGPAARSGHAVAFDSGRGRLVLFGGVKNNQRLARDTWERYLGAWHKLPKCP